MNKHAVLLPERSHKHGFFYGYVIVIAGFLIMALMWGTTLSFGVFFKPLATEFGWTRAVTSGAYSLSMLINGLLCIIAGRITDRFGPRAVMTVCGFFLGLGYLLMSQISNVWQIYLFFGVMVGIGISGSFVPLLTVVTRWFVKRRGLMSGIVISGTSVGTLIIPPLANQLITDYGWRNSYIIMGITALVVVIIAVQFLKHDPRQIGQLPYGADEVNTGSLNLEDTGFSFQEALSSRQFWLFGLIYALAGIGQVALLVHIVPHATDLGISAIVAANIIGGLNIAGRVGLGSAVDRIGYRKSLTITLTVLTVALIWLQVAKEVWMIYLFAVAFGFSHGGIAVLMSPAVAELFGLRAQGAILGVTMFIWGVGATVGPIFTGRIFDTTGNYYLAFMVCAILSATGLALILLLKPGGKPVRSSDL